MKKEVNPNDLDDAIKYYSKTYKQEIDKKDLFLQSIEFESPKELLKDIYVPEVREGELDVSYGREKIIEKLNEIEIRRFKRIINNFFDGKLTPAIQINGKLCDGFGRCILYHALGKKILVAKFFLITI
ncbi:MAG: hypothetical protein ACFFDN_16625 [Candidatus Hodarchaeota archaeon]